MSSAHFTPALFSYLKDLKAHNTREWFEDNRERYGRDVEGPMLAFIADLAPRMARISRAIVVDPKRHGGSMFRIYRDTRFSTDKSPYKTHVAAMFAHRDRKKGISVPGFYLHLEPGDSMGGGGIYHPDAPTLTRIRLAIVEHPKGWRAVLETGMEIEGDTLSRAPAGFDPAHPFLADLKRKDHYTMVEFSQKQVTQADFVDRFAGACADVAPLVAFLTRAVGLKW